MSTDARPQPTRTDATPPGPSDPFSGLGDGQVLRCRDPETGWQWFYERDGASVLKYHERTDYAAEVTALAAVGETIDCEGVESCSVSRVYVKVYAGETDR